MRTKTAVALAALSTLSLALGSPAAAKGKGKGKFKADLEGAQEVPAISTAGSGTISIRAAKDGSALDYELSYEDMSSAVAAAHIHLGQAGVNGGVSAFLCGGGGKPACPASGTVTGTVLAADIVGPAGQGIAAGELAELLAAMDDGLTYANVHTASFPSGEIRGQIE